MDGIAMISTERKRQIEKEGCTPEHDDAHNSGEMALAAACYAVPPENRDCTRQKKPYAWPWMKREWKPTPDDRIRELVKAGALIAAEIDRLQRLAQQETDNA